MCYSYRLLVQKTFYVERLRHQTILTTQEIVRECLPCTRKLHLQELGLSGAGWSLLNHKECKDIDS